MRTVENPEIAELYTKIGDNPHFLEVPSEMQFVESALHTAALEGRTSLALEILRLKPSLGKKLNLNGLSPLHLALENGHTNTVKRLVKHDPNLIRVPGREGITLLHYTMEKGDIDLLIYFLLIGPSSINDVTVRDETVVHIAVRNRNLRALKVLLGWARKTNNTAVFGWRNEDGNDVMHLAALTNQPKVMKSLIKYVRVNKKNLEGKTALDILNPENVEARKILISAGAKEGSSLVDHATICEKYLKSPKTIIEYFMTVGAYLDLGLSGDLRNAILVVVVLIATATATFQAILTPPLWISHNDTPPLWISHNDTISVFPNITSVYNDTNLIYSTSTNFNKRTPLMAKETIFFNIIAFILAMETCVILTFDLLLLFLWQCPALFSVSYGLLVYGIYPGTEGSFIPLAVMLSIAHPILIILPWKKVKMQIREDICYEYNLYEVKYLTFGSRFIIQGPILTRMKATR